LSPLNPLLNGHSDPEWRFWQRVEKTETCWLWTGAKAKFGHGSIYVDGKSLRAHTYSFLLHGGVVPEGMQVNHTCDTPGCVRPDHLYAGTQQQNVDDMNRRGRNYYSNRSECPKGHPYDEENTIITKQGRRRCRKCHNEETRARYREKKAS
jgi:hypothetical protein